MDAQQLKKNDGTSFGATFAGMLGKCFQRYELLSFCWDKLHGRSEPCCPGQETLQFDKKGLLQVSEAVEQELLVSDAWTVRFVFCCLPLFAQRYSI